jgi:hypothetical protein
MLAVPLAIRYGLDVRKIDIAKLNAAIGEAFGRGYMRAFVGASPISP